MCGVIGYTGEKQAEPILLNSLARLEYRGYDSCGVAVMNGGISVYKDAVRVETLARKAPKFTGTVGIGHTRWATFGRPSLTNAHPHLDCTGKIAVVHNGIIHNYQELKKELLKEGHRFTSETDTEIIPHLIEKYYRGSLEEAVRWALSRLDGSYAIIVMMTGESELVAARKESPLIVGIGDRENFVASDVPAVLDYTNRVIYLEDGDIAVVGKNQVRVANDGKPVSREEKRTLWNATDAQKGGYEHFMLKEIHEQPRVINDTVREYLAQGKSLGALASGDFDGILFVASGTSYHAALVGKHIAEELLQFPARVELASEFSYGGRIPSGALCLALTQSGETADTLKAIQKLKADRHRVIAITNVVGSSVTRLADDVIYTRAGPEISVAATKSFIAQLAVLYLMFALTGRNSRAREGFLSELRQIPVKVQQILDNKETVMAAVNYLSQREQIFYVGRGINFPIALEGALKMKEVAYLFAEGYPAGEFKHGSFALLTEDTPVIAIVPRDRVRSVLFTNVKEIKARGSPVIAVAHEGDEEVREVTDLVIDVPQINPLLAPILNVISLQLLAYYVARKRGCPIDFPRNLAKSVTVE